MNLARHTDEVYRDQYPRAASVRKIVANEKTIGAYLIGRQLCTVTTVFFAANLTVSFRYLYLDSFLDLCLKFFCSKFS